MNLFSSSQDMANQEAFARLTPGQPVKAGFFEGIPSSVGMAAGSVLNDAARPLSDVATPVLLPLAKKIDEIFKTDAQGYLKAEQAKTREAMHDWTPDPTTVGWLGQAVYGAGNIIGDVVVGTMATGNPLAGVTYASGAQGYKTFSTAQDKGVDNITALKMAGITGASTFIGAFLPIYATKPMAAGLTGLAMQAEVAGASRLASTLYGTAGVTAYLATNTPANLVAAGALQTVTGIPTRGATSSVLANAGYADMAKQYEAFDAAELASDFAMGVLFGAGAKGFERVLQGRSVPEPRPSDLAAAMTLDNAGHIEIGTAPGLPTDPAARQAHVQTVIKALDDMLAGRDVQVGEEVTAANFMENPNAVVVRQQIASAIDEHMGPEWQTIKSELAARGLPTDEVLYSIRDRVYTPPVRVTSEVTRISEMATKQGWDTTRILEELGSLAEKLAVKNANASEPRERVRGTLWLQERLTRAERTGELTSQEVALGKWLLEKNPNIGNELGISIKESAGTAGGEYDPIKKIATFFLGGGRDQLTVAHEFLHHTERMLPEPIRLAIQGAWIKELRAVEAFAKRTQSDEMMRAVADTLRAASGDMVARDRVIEQIQTGKVDKNFYALMNPSEFWAVNASKLVSERAGAESSMFRQAAQWVKELVQKVKDLFGFRSDAAVIRGLDEILKSDGVQDGRFAYEGAKLYPNVKKGGDSRPVLREDIPNESWLKGKVDYAIQKGRNQYGVPHMSTVTGSFDKPVEVSLRVLSQLKGERGEQSNVRENSLQYIRDNWEEVSKQPPYIEVAYNGEAWVSEGNHRIMVALEKGLESMPVEIRYFDGGQLRNGPLSPSRIPSLDESSSAIFQNIRTNLVEQPGVDVAPENKNGFEPDLRVRVNMGKIELPAKPMVLTGTNTKNAQRQIENIDQILAKFPDADTSPLAWSRMMAYAFGTDDVPVPPYRFLADINSDGAVKSLSRLSKGQIDDANHGFENAQAFRQAYTDGTMQVEDTGKLFMWSFLSRGVSPYVQEGLFIDAFPGVDKWITKAAKGELTEADFGAYEAWAKSVSPQGSGQPGSGATHNLNAFGKLFLFKMSQKDSDGVSLMQKMHNMMADPNMTGKEIRRWFISNTEGVGIDNKVVSFTLLVAGFKDVMVLDRVQIRQLWDDGRFGNRNLYDGRKEGGKPVAGSALSDLTYGARGLLIYEAVERALAKRVENIYAALGRPDDASIGRYHWETWVADSQQEASHGTLDAILATAKGETAKIAEVTAKEGEYGAYAYGARYGRDAQGNPYFLYNTPLGNEYRFTVGAFREFIDAVKLPKNEVVPSKFKVTEAGNAPWYQKAEVNKLKLDELARGFAGGEGTPGQGGGAVQEARPGQAVPDLARRGDPFSPEALIGNNPSLTVIKEDGTMVSAGRALRDVDAEIAAAERDSQGFDAAIACALRG